MAHISLCLTYPRQLCKNNDEPTVTIPRNRWGPNRAWRVPYLRDRGLGNQQKVLRIRSSRFGFKDV